MIGALVRNVLSFFHIGNGSLNSPVDTRRKFTRHNGVHAEVSVGNRAYSIRDWSLGGVSFETAPDAGITAGDKILLVLKFRFLHETITIQHPAEIVRTAKRGIAAQFSPLSIPVRRDFDRVLDSLHTERFLASQAA